MTAAPLSPGQEAHRAALDHVLDLMTGLPCGDALVLRGSRLLRAWAGERAREPADLDFIVLPEQAVPVDRLDPYPYVSGLDVVQQWPEYAGGAGAHEMWKDEDEEFATRGIRAFVPPDGLHWDTEPDSAPFAFREDLEAAMTRRRDAACGVRFDPDDMKTDGTWAYSYGEEGPGGIRLILPWTRPGGSGGRVQVDIAFDVPLPEPPAWTRIPLGPDGARELVLRAATPELSLAWKLLWLHADSATTAGPRPKDLYDAVILAEDSRVRLTPKLLRKVMDNVSPKIAVPAATAWAEFAEASPGARGPARAWLDRLSTALPAGCLAPELTKDG